MTEAAVLGSMRSQLLRWLLIPLAALVVIDAMSVYHDALRAADHAYDRSLLASTRALAERVTLQGGKVVADVPYVALDSIETDTPGSIFYKVTGIANDFVSGYEDLPPVPQGTKRSEAYPALVYFYHASYRGERVRIAALYQPVYDDRIRGIALIQVGETLEARRDLSRKILTDTLLREATLIAAAALIVWIAIGFVLRPLKRLRQQVEERKPTNLSGFDPMLVHKEVRPLVTAMNGYIDRLRALIDGQRRFIADASHQLRTPLTVLKTQTDLALRENDPNAARELLGGIGKTTDATIHLANRLLALARLDHGVGEGEMRRVALSEVARQVALELAQEAVKKDIDLAFEAGRKVSVGGHELLLHEMVANLVDNAIRYTPPGGMVTVRVLRVDVPLLEVEDSGPGIPADERERVFAPFYRGASSQERHPGGTGLGLTIVRDIAALHGATVEFGGAAGGSGLRVRVFFRSNERNG